MSIQIDFAAWKILLESPLEDPKDRIVFLLNQQATWHIPRYGESGDDYLIRTYGYYVKKQQDELKKLILGLMLADYFVLGLPAKIWLAGDRGSRFGSQCRRAA